MAELLEACKFKPSNEFSDPDYKCSHPIERDGLCIFHLPKPTEEQKQVMTHEARMAAEAIEEEFRQAFSKLLEEEEKNPEAKVCEYLYFQFPAICLSERDFKKPLNLSGATFSGEVNFCRANFSEWTNFWKATFKGKADFGQAFFNEWVGFCEITFKGEVDFCGVTFKSWAGFWGTTFSGEADFRVANFIGRADFRGANFSMEADFGRAIFQEQARFVGKIFESRCNFWEVELDEKAKVLFEKANFSQASFLDTNLEQVHFRDVQWPRKGRRQVLWDEFPRAGWWPDYEKVAENYRQLVLNYEAKRDFNAAEDFHIGEMEMRRKKKGEYAIKRAKSTERQWMARIWRGLRVVCEWLNGYAAYRLLSKYGTSYWRGLLVLFVWIALFSGAFLYTGFAPSKENFEISRARGGADPIRVIEYNIRPDATHHPVSFGQWMSDYGKSVLLTLSILTFQKERFYEPANELSQLVLYSAVLVLPAQTALILFAIRRR
jgi:uncharacterized protein YjbI with pentapeptide repeats